MRLLRQSVHLGSFAIQLVRTDGDRLSESELQHLLVGDEPLSEVFDAFVTPVTKAEAGSAALPFAQQVKPAVYIDCTGLGGHNLGGPVPFDICIRTDKHGQSVYGPSVAPIEATKMVHRTTYRVVALGGPKPCMTSWFYTTLPQIAPTPQGSFLAPSHLAWTGDKGRIISRK